MDEDAPQEFAALAPVVAGIHPVAKALLVLAEAAFDVPALAVAFSGKMFSPAASIGLFGRRKFVRGSPGVGLDDTGGMEFVTDDPVVLFTVIPRVGKEFVKRLGVIGFADGLGKLAKVGIRPPVGDCSGIQVRGHINDHGELGHLAFL